MFSNLLNPGVLKITLVVTLQTTSVKKNTALPSALLTGILLGLSFPTYPFIHLEPLAWVAFVPLLLSAKNDLSFGSFYRRIYIAMFAFVMVSVWWISLSTVLGGVLTYFAQSFFLTIPWSVFYLINKRVGWKPALFSFPFVWTAWEWIYLDMDISFGWLTLGNSQANLYWLIQYVDLFGTWAISFWIVLFNILAVLAVERWQTGGRDNMAFAKQAALIVALMLVPPLAYSAYIFAQPEPVQKQLSVSIVQPNIDPFAKWETMTRRDILEKNIGMSDSVVQSSKPDMILWPETAIPYFILLPNSSTYRDRLFTKVTEWNTPLLTGFSDAVIYADSTERQAGAKYDEQIGQYYDTFNSAMLMCPADPEPDVYHKMELVPFAERVPYMEYIPFFSKATVKLAGISSWGRGKNLKNMGFRSQAGDSVQVCGLICYESIYPGFVAKFVRQGANFLTVITNDGWFSKSYGPYQHAAFSRLRCIETRRAMARCANTGITFFIDRYGRTYGEIPWWEARTTTAPVGLATEHSFYVSHIDIFPKMCTGMASLLILVAVAFPLVRRSGQSWRAVSPEEG
ncbi:MAG: apolipoprotein N-acyltransferase [Chlorobiales bacterium]|nr:apolipoprotein N-acyltransferase [Chlorobiales bacterium]